MYEQCSANLPDSDAFLKLFIGREFHEVVELLCSKVFKTGNHTSRAEAYIQLHLIDAFFEGIPDDLARFTGFYQVNHKKAAITLNEMVDEDKDFHGVGNDVHVENTVKHFKPENCGNLDNFIMFICRNMPPELGWWMNEILGQMGQFVSSKNKSIKTKQYGLRVFQKLRTEYPGEYDELFVKLQKNKK